MGIKWPRHAASMTISHNRHKDYYETVAEAIENGQYPHEDFISEEEKKICIKSDEVWEIQWYPDTPVGFCIVIASTFEAALNATLKEG